MPGYPAHPLRRAHGAGQDPRSGAAWFGHRVCLARADLARRDPRGRPPRRAVRLANSEGIRRPFVILAGGRLDELLNRLRLLAPAHGPFADSILTGAATPPPAGPAAGEHLSERESEVLRYLPTMLTAADIATEPDVSVNTVKVHMKAIYRKLGAARRSEAVAHARANGPCA
jgi:LuxR family maltose regulon positive regulatory protein